VENILDDEFREMLQNYDQFLEIVNTCIDMVNEEEDPCDSAEFEILYRFTVQTLVQEYINDVYVRNILPIKNLFLNALILTYIKRNSLGLIIHPIQNDTEREIKEFIHHYEKQLEFINWYENKYSSLEGIEEYLDAKVKDNKLDHFDRDDMRCTPSEHMRQN
jgi:hypothetical protein